ncbi:MAG: DUF481 domain-containing protein [Planctomycetota bacterium]
MSMLPLLVSLLPSADATAAHPYPLNTTFSLQDAEAEAPAEEAEENPGWTGSASAGATLTRGNSETLNIGLTFDAEKRTDEDRWTFGSWFTLSEQTVKTVDETVPEVNFNDETTAKDYGARLQYDRFVNEELYWYANAGFEKDEIAQLQVRARGGFGAGYQFRDDEDFTLNGEAGLTYIHEDLEGASPNDYVALRLAYNLWKQLTETTQLTQSAELFPSLKDSEDWNATLDTAIDVTISASMFLRVQHVLEYDNTVARGLPIGIGDGAKKADHRIMTTLGWTF